MTGGEQMLRAFGQLFGNYPLYAVLLSASVCLSVFLAIFGLRRRASRGATEFIFCMTAVAEWSIGYFLELIAPTLSMKLLAAQIEYLGIATLPALWLLLAARYTARIDLARPIRIALLMVLPAITIGLAFTNSLHGLLWSRTWMDAAVSPPVLHVAHGPMFWVYMVYAYILLLMGTLLFIVSLVTSPPFYRGASFAMIVAAAAPWIGNVLYLSGLNPSPGFDTTPFAFAVSGSAVAWVLFRRRFLDIVPFARERVVETMRDPVIVIDAADRIVDSNPAAAFLLRGTGARIGAHVASVLPDWERIRVELAESGGPLSDLLLGGAERRRAFEIDATDVSDRKRGLSGRVIVLHETTERRMMEAVLRASEEKYRSLVESIDQVIFSLDLKGTFTYVSPVVEKISGYSAAAIVGSPFSRFVHPDDLTLVAKNMEARYRGESGQNEFRVIDSNGAVLYVRTSSSPLVERGIVTGLTGIMTDITEQRMLVEQLHQSQKMEAVGRLAGGIAHDFNNLLTAIMGFAQMLLMDESLEGESREWISEIRKSIDRGAGLVRQLLAFSRKQVLQPRRFDLNEMIRGTEKMLARLIGEHVRLALALGEPPLAIRADPGQVELVVLNLAVNARDAMPDGGTLTIATAAAADGGVVLSISDTGCGMDEKVKGHLFEPFFTTKAPGSGTGLGLSTVYGIVKQSGGSISVESAPGAGTTIAVSFPPA
jgi:PAS domain S-box-containing protein